MICPTCRGDTTGPLTLPNREAVSAISVWFTAGQISIRYADGKTVRRPISCSTRLARASHQERMDYEIHHGTHIRWPTIDEDIDAVRFLGFPEDLGVDPHA